MKKEKENIYGYPLSNLTEKQSIEAYRFACDTRKFEIELYWKRATYFWGFLIIIFGGYYLANEKLPDNHEFKLIIACLGFIFSLSWYLVNRASKFWQENWESHIMYLEDEIAGPIYKTTIDNSQFKFWKVWQRYGFSISKINQLVSLYITVIWLYNIFKFISNIFEIHEPFNNFNLYFILFLTIAFIVLIFIYGRSDLKHRKIKFNAQIKNEE